MNSLSSFISLRRLNALCKKETLQILRDPSSWLIAFILPILLLFIFAYGINLDSSKVRIGIVVQQENSDVRDLVSAFIASPNVDATISHDRSALIEQMQEGKIRGIIIIPVDFSQALLSEAKHPVGIQVITDGSEPNTANFVQAYANGIWQTWLVQQSQDSAQNIKNPIDIRLRYWFNADATSRNFIVPGAITIIMTVLGSILTSLVIAREWERGTMEALLSTQITRAELLISKLLPYYLLGLIAMLICMLVSLFILQIPFRGSYIILFILTSLFLFSVLGIGLLFSTITRNQFNAAQIALNAAFLPAVMLSGFIFEIKSMPFIVQCVTYIIPARYFVNSLQTLFLAGNIPYLLIINGVFLFAATCFFLGITAKKTRCRLD